MSVSPQGLNLITAVLADPAIDVRVVSLSRATRRLFDLVEAGECDYDTLKESVVEPEQAGQVGSNSKA